MKGCWPPLNPYSLPFHSRTRLHLLYKNYLQTGFKVLVQLKIMKMNLFLCAIILLVADVGSSFRTKFKVYRENQPCSKTESIFPGSKPSTDANCWDYVDFPRKDCISLSAITRVPFWMLELQGWNVLSVYDSPDCSGNSTVVAKGGTHCFMLPQQYSWSDRHVQTRDEQKHKCYPGPFLSVSGTLFKQPSSTTFEVEKQLDECQAREQFNTIAMMDNRAPTDRDMRETHTIHIGVSITKQDTKGGWDQNGSNQEESLDKGVEWSKETETAFGGRGAFQKFFSSRISMKLFAKFGASIGRSSMTGANWNTLSANVKTTSYTVERVYTVKPGLYVIFEQAVGMCGPFQVGLHHVRARIVNDDVNPVLDYDLPTTTTISQ